ncbi:MAG: pantoate--beta-alanine ligase [Lutibacter sp.]
MVVTKEIRLLQNYLNSLSKSNSIGFVPTMGALHQGHLSLIKNAKKSCKTIVVSIFVNPTQFNNQQDLINYPSTLQNDLDLLKEVGVDLVFTPSINEIYGQDVNSENFDFDGLEQEMEGKFRPGHFNGVATIVKRLFEIVKPTRAYFGEKDFQQLQIIRKLVAKFNLPVEIIPCSIHREKDGLAMSSRNARLTKKQREAAPFIYQTLKVAKKMFGTKNVEEINAWVTNQFKNNALLSLEYFIIANEKTLKPISHKKTNELYRAFIAVFAGEIRLIDNISL